MACDTRYSCWFSEILSELGSDHIRIKPIADLQTLLQNMLLCVYVWPNEKLLNSCSRNSGSNSEIMRKYKDTTINGMKLKEQHEQVEGDFEAFENEYTKPQNRINDGVVLR